MRGDPRGVVGLQAARMSEDEVLFLYGRPSPMSAKGRLC
jgi:hypothetical protein